MLLLSLRLSVTVNKISQNSRTICCIVNVKRFRTPLIIGVCLFFHSWSLTKILAYDFFLITVCNFFQYKCCNFFYFLGRRNITCFQQHFFFSIKWLSGMYWSAHMSVKYKQYFTRILHQNKTYIHPILFFIKI